jgi:septum formation protein
MVQVMLASRSPRRRKILEQLGLPFEAVAPDVEEIEFPDDPSAMVCENARRKWRWCFERFPGAAIIAADTTVELDGRCLGKPSSREEAFAMLRTASGRVQTVHTGFVLALPGENPPCAASEVSRVFFRDLTDAGIEAYLDAVQPLDRAGAYDIDCRGDWIIDHCEGSRTNVMGLPAERVQEWMKCKLAL